MINWKAIGICNHLSLLILIPGRSNGGVIHIHVYLHVLLFLTKIKQISYLYCQCHCGDWLGQSSHFALEQSLLWGGLRTRLRWIHTTICLGLSSTVQVCPSWALVLLPLRDRISLWCEEDHRFLHEVGPGSACWWLGNRCRWSRCDPWSGRRCDVMLLND